ncbi:DUF1801 domain-containing protein [Flavobacterium sp.]|jgi:uncharacterized protein YdhG (YjbR/CyaY superfamily)|uniref:DUF1801 domain-containing protein n=1 Tax=Flavobacterium sp. TaxID=239 RepID=UPI0037BE525D
MMQPDILQYNNHQTQEEQIICHQLAEMINQSLPEAESKIWHAHPVWFLEGNPIVGYSKLKSGIRLLFWSGVTFEEKELKPGSGKFKDASITYTTAEQIQNEDLQRWLQKGQEIQWDYKNIVKRKGVLERLK